MLLRVLALVCLALGLLALVEMNPPASTVPFFNERFGTYCVAIAVFAFVAWVARKAHEKSEPDAGLSWTGLAAAAALVISLLILIAIGWEIHSYWWLRRWTGDWSRMENYQMYAQFTYSAFFMLYGAVLLSAGFWRRSAFLRWQALVLLAVAIAKVFLFDMSQLSQGFRILSFLGLGALLLAVSFVYQRDWLNLARPGRPEIMRIGAVLLLLALAAPTPEIRYFHYERPLENIPQTAGQACLALDAGVFAHAEPELADLRLYRNSTETAYVIQTSAPTAAAEQSINPVNLGRRGGQTVFDADMPAGNYSDLQLDITGHDFIATVTVTGSQAQDGSAGTKIGSYTIFDLTKQKLGRSTVLHLPESDFRILHFSIAGPIAPDSVNGLSVVRLAANSCRNT